MADEWKGSAFFRRLTDCTCRVWGDGWRRPRGFSDSMPMVEYTGELRIFCVKRVGLE